MFYNVLQRIICNKGNCDNYFALYLYLFCNWKVNYRKQIWKMKGRSNWYPDAEETFFGNDKDIVYEVAGKDEYIKVAV